MKKFLLTAIDLQAIPTPNPEKGIYIRVVGGKAIKVVK